MSFYIIDHSLSHPLETLHCTVPLRAMSSNRNISVIMPGISFTRSFGQSTTRLGGLGSQYIGRSTEQSPKRLNELNGKCFRTIGLHTSCCFLLVGHYMTFPASRNLDLGSVR
jgi:hypothetical protein